MRVTRVLLFLLGAAAIASAQSLPSDLSRRIIHIPDYQSVPGDVYQLAVDFSRPGAIGNAGAGAGASFPIILSDDLTLEVPFIGRVSTEGRSFRDLRQEVESRVRTITGATFVQFTLEAPALFDVFVYGAAGRPGIIRVNSLNRLADMREAAQIGGGASTRRLLLSREGSVTGYDLLRYFAFGEEEQNPFLRPGDRIEVQPVDVSVTVSGAVFRPGAFEMLPGETGAELLAYAGGLQPTAREAAITLERVDASGEYQRRNLSLEDLQTLALREGDRISVGSTLVNAAQVIVEGAVFGAPLTGEEPGTIPSQVVRVRLPHREGVGVLDALAQVGGITPFAETTASFILRAESGEREMIPDLLTIWRTRDRSRDPGLNPGDTLVIPILPPEVFVTGEVNAPDRYPFLSGAIVADYIGLARGVTEDRGSINRVFFVDEEGRRHRTSLDSPVQPGSTILVGNNVIGSLDRIFNRNVFVVTGIVTGVIGVLDLFLGDGWLQEVF